MASDKRGKFWQADWFVGLLIVLAVMVLHATTDFLGGLERRFYDYASTTTARQPSDRIAVIAIDDQSIANLGRWPWPRELHAQLIDMLARAKAKTIVQTVLYFEPQVDRGLTYIQKMKELLPASGDPVAGGSTLPAELAKVIAEAETALDSDAKLSDSMRNAGNVLVPSVYQLGAPQGNPDSQLPDFALKSAVEDSQGFSILASKGQQPIERIGSAAAGVAHLNQTRDVDGAVRFEPLLVNYFGAAVPSMALLASIKSLNLEPHDIRVLPGEGLQIGKLRIRTDDTARMLPQFYPQRDGKPAFAVDSFYDVISGKIPPSKYAGKVVLIGATASGAAEQFTTPGYAALSSAETLAHITSSILSEHFIVQPSWGVWAAMGVFLFVSLYLILVLPRLSAGLAASTTLLLFVALLGTEFGLLSAVAFWLQLVFPASLLVIGYLALTTKRFLVTEMGKLRSDEESAETNRMMGIALQSQGQLDMAFDRFRRVPLSEAVTGNLYSLGLDFERKRQFNKAQAVYEHIATFDGNYKDLQARLNRAKGLADTVMLGGSGGHPGGLLLLDGGGVEKPMLGRYQVEKELGKGAMGVVYLGKDPKIGRVVAIKTLALSQEFEGDALDDARERFFREAETAGRLQHQNIVTIFDAGEEHDLAYIAMEFLKGRDLLDFCKPDHLLPVERVVSIVARVAEALDYAHRQNVVHRDIKPANIMYALDTDTVKVTDFGIARITDSSKTKTGMVLGTPSFMSPEQLAGKKVDGRSDLYSLGVMLYQLLTGVLPFRGDSMAELMYKIANEEAVDVRQLRPELPAALATVVQRALAKRPEARYQHGHDFAVELGACLASVAGLPQQVPAPLPPPTAFSPAPAPAAPTQSWSATAAQTVAHQPVAPAPDYDATQGFSEDVLAAYAKTVAVHRPVIGEGPKPLDASDMKNPDTR